MKALKRTRRILNRFFIVILIAAVLFTAAGILFTKRYGEEIKTFTINQINRQLETKINVGHIDFSFFSRFPYLSVVFTDVTALSGPDFSPGEFIGTETDTLFTARKIFVQFNVFDILFRKYHIRRISASDGNLNMLVDTRGNTNFRLLKRKEPRESRSAGFELQAVKLDNFDIRFINLAKNIQSSALIREVLFKGKFSERHFSFGTVTSLSGVNFTRDGVHYADHFDVNARVIFNVSDTLASVEKGEVSINNLRMNIDGNFTLSKISEIDLELEGRNFDLHSLQSALPEPQREAIPVDVYGKGDLAFRLNGKFSRLEMPSIRGVYLLNVSKARYHDRLFHNIKIKGQFSNGKRHNPLSTIIDVEQYSIEEDQTALNGRFQVRNLKQPYIRLTMKGEISPGTMNTFFSAGQVNDFTGTLHPDFELVTQLNSWKVENAERILSSGLNGRLGFEDFGFILLGKYPFSHVNGNIDFSGDTWYPSLSLNSGRSSLGMRLQVVHMFNYLMDRASSMWISGDVDARRIDLTPFIQPGDQETGIFAFPGRVHARLNLKVDSLTAGKFAAYGSEAFLQYKPGMVSANSVHMHTMDGTVAGSAAIIQDSDKSLYLRTQNDVTHLNIKTMFHDLNNFTQDFIVSENLKGYLSGNIDFATSFDSLLNMSSKDTEADARIVISSGELINFGPVEELSDYVALEELKHIQFSKLQNHIVIHNRQVVIPQMDIQSSAFNMTISGVHRFDNHFDYKLQVNLSEFLAGKARKAKKENEDFGVIEPDSRRTNLYLTISGTPDDFKVRYDKKEAIVNIREDIHEEKSRLKNILNEEFGWFRKDTLKNKGTRTTDDPKFILDWGEDQPADTALTGGGKKKSGQTEKKKFRIEWDEDDH